MTVNDIPSIMKKSYFPFREPSCIQSIFLLEKKVYLAEGSSPRNSYFYGSPNRFVSKSVFFNLTPPT